jgi:chemotaxis regulatin CheY-phosphate phosphatase CheZ
VVKYFNQQQSTLPTNCKDSEKNVTTQIEQVLKRWQEYFYNILNPKETSSTSVSITESLSDNYKVSSTKYNEICIIIIIQNLKKLLLQIIYPRIDKKLRKNLNRNDINQF